MSPRSVQKVASDVGMDVDARNIAEGRTSTGVAQSQESEKKGMSFVGVGGDRSDELWWDGLEGGDSGTWKGSGEDCTERVALNISIEDYL